MGQKKVQTSSVCIEAFKSLAGVFFLQGSLPPLCAVMKSELRGTY